MKIKRICKNSIPETTKRISSKAYDLPESPQVKAMPGIELDPRFKG